MHTAIETLKQLANQTITKGKLPALQKAQADANRLYEQMEPRASDNDTLEQFDSACDNLESAMDELDAAIDELDDAEDKDEREDAVANIESALEQVVSAWEELLPDAELGKSNPRVARDALEQECSAKLKEVFQLPKEQWPAALQAFINSGPTPSLVAERREIITRLLGGSSKSASK
jgi:hypothetical protein